MQLSFGLEPNWIHKYFFQMSNKTRTVIKGISVVLALLTIAMHLHWIIIPALSPYVIWMLVASYGMLLLSSK